MTPSYALLKTEALKKRIPFTQTHLAFDIAHLDDPAQTVMTDFQKRPPYSTSAKTPISEALQQMKLLNVKSLFVINADNQIIGHIAARDIQGTKAAMLANQLDIKIPEMTTQMLMTPPEELPTLQFKELSNVRVGHIVRLLAELNSNYIFVVDVEHGQEVLRGLFSISRISQQLGENVMSDLSSHSLAEINKVFNL